MRRMFVGELKAMYEEDGEVDMLVSLLGVVAMWWMKRYTANALVERRTTPELNEEGRFQQYTMPDHSLENGMTMK